MADINYSIIHASKLIIELRLIFQVITIPKPP